MLETLKDRCQTIHTQIADLKDKSRDFSQPKYISVVASSIVPEQLNNQEKEINFEFDRANEIRVKNPKC